METYKAWVLERGSAELGIPRMNGFYSQIHALIDAIDDAIQHGIPEGSPMAKERIDPERMPFETWSSIEVGRINRILGRIEVEASNGALNPGANVSPKSVLYLLKTARAVAIQRRAA